MLAAAALMFAACAQFDTVNEVPESEPQAIGFDTFSKKITRAKTVNTLESYYTTFGVWAYKTPTGGAETTVMDHYKVAYNDPNWDYDGILTGQSLKYWDKLASYTFYAYAPYNSTAVDINNTTKDITIDEGEYAANQNLQTSLNTTINGDVFTGTESATDKSTDWMIATPIERDPKETELVQEEFKHTMSKLIVILKSTVANTTINSFSIGNIHGTGSFTTATNKWTATSAIKSLAGAIGSLTTANTGYYAMECLVIPSADDPNLSINYTINNDTYDVKNLAITSITEFEENTCYTLTVTIDLDAIQFDASQTNFGEGSGSINIE